jgi:16S rRNA (cytosine967-C5)-methyltransferase
LSAAEEGRAPGLDARLAAASAFERIRRQRLDLGRAFAPPRGLAASDRAFAYTILTTALRRRGQIEAVLAGLLEKELPARSGMTGSILTTAAAELLYLNVPPHAAINSAISLCREDRQARHFAGLANAVLRRLSREGAARLAATPETLNTPGWLFDRWRRQFGDETATAIAKAHLVEPPLDLTAPADAPATARHLGGELLWNGTVRLVHHKGLVEDLPGYPEGGWWVQDQAAAIPAMLFRGPPGAALDACAAPGGKTAQLVAAGNTVTAVDRSGARLVTLRENLSRLRMAATIIEADVLQFSPEQRFDKVLLDAPCTATGTIRRHPDIPWLRTGSDIEKLSRLQAQLLEHVAELVRPGGELVYCTCSLEREEGEDRITAFLESRGDYRRDPVTTEEVDGHRALLNAKGDLRTLPHHGLDGFFAARLVRRER